MKTQLQGYQVQDIEYFARVGEGCRLTVYTNNPNLSNGFSSVKVREAHDLETTNGLGTETGIFRYGQ